MRRDDRGAFARFLPLLPALLLAEAALGLWSLYAGLPPTGASDAWRIGAASFAGGVLLLLRALPLLFLLAWPLLRLRGPHARVVAVGLLFTAWLLARIALEQFHLAARVPLGAELFGYSFAELRTTVGAGARTDALALAGWIVPPALLWLALGPLARWRPRTPRALAFALPLACALAWLPPLQPAAADWPREDAYALALDKPAYFVAENLRWLRRDDAPAPTAAAVASAHAGTADPRHPFVHEERTPDVLGPLFADGDAPPHLVFVIVEGLGRSFSGPDATLGSFTPFLDDLATRSLYFDNFLANQGRTFGVLPSLFGSLPFGAEGYAALGERMPPHAGLLSLLAAQGYSTSFYIGTDADFDNERLYLQRQGVQRIVDIHDFGTGYPRSPGGDLSWGYADGELIRRVLADGAPAGDAPTLRVIQTISMHTPYSFPGQAAYHARFAQRLDALGIAGDARAAYTAFAPIYQSVLYTDDALRAFFEAEARTPAYANTIYVVTGDHRLPELPMADRIERYHVPLLIHSPLLKQPRRIRAVSSHLDVAPSLLAFLAHRHGLKRPARATWLGKGLDLSPAFRNVHDIPLKQSKTLLTDFVSGAWYLNRGQLYALSDGMAIEPANDPTTAAQVEARFAAFRAANDRFGREGELSPEGAAPALVAYVEPPPASAQADTVAGPPFAVRTVDLPPSTPAARIQVSALFANDAATPSPTFVPLVVVSGEDGVEVGEYYGAALQLPAHARREVPVAVDLGKLAPGRYFVAVIPSHPDTGHSLGAGRYRIPLQVRAGTAP
ncbi:MAG TPA: LTA synthase family protein [Xanthomonadaceae bacterium]|nr:LTA synthase family protein [Xanthomonadaceae bacterium]